MLCDSRLPDAILYSNSLFGPTTCHTVGDIALCAIKSSLMTWHKSDSTRGEVYGHLDRSPVTEGSGLHEDDVLWEVIHQHKSPCLG